ncbi:MAG: hypothetical protein GY816_10445, partial [Cytophagales bacterium]|nr:hypothetical protein [Cytophagales bacterium]
MDKSRQSFEPPNLLNDTDLISTLCSSTYFKFEDATYKQLRGVPMGSPVSVAIAEIFMHLLESSALDCCPNPPIFYGRYIDDIIVITKSPTELQRFHQHMNNSCATLVTTINFTMEAEEGGSLPFLDISISRSANRLNFSVYRKKTHSDRYCHPHSSIPRSILSGIVKGMRYRAQKYCDTKDALTKEISHLDSTFLKNGYDHKILHHHLHFPLCSARKKPDMTLATV